MKTIIVVNCFVLITSIANTPVKYEAQKQPT